MYMQTGKIIIVTDRVFLVQFMVCILVLQSMHPRHQVFSVQMVNYSYILKLR